MTNAIGNAPSGDADIDIMVQADRWDTATLTFGIPTNADQYGAYQYGKYDDDGNWMPADETAGFVAPDPNFIEAVRDAMAAVESLTNLDLVEAVVNPGDAVVRAGITTQPKSWMEDAGAYAVGPKDESDPLYHIAGDAWFDPGLDYRLGKVDYTTAWHEMAHTVGLSDVNRVEANVNMMSEELRSPEFTIMSYMGFIGATSSGWSISGNHGPQSFMMYDIAGLQYMYGADFTTHAGNTMYTFDSATGEMFIGGAGQGTPVQNIIFRTIWDGGGVDTYNFASYGADRDLDIDLAPGGWSDVDRDSHFQAANLGGGPNEGYARGQVFNALLYQGDTRSLIENAIGGAGNDSICGNQADNLLQGGAGDDSLHGFAGHDTLVQGAGGGLLDGGDGHDVLVAGSGAETILGGAGADRVSYAASTGSVFVNLATNGGAFGGAHLDTYAGIEHVTGSAHGDTVIGNDGENNLQGGDGDDSLNGGHDTDVLNGGEGEDTLQGGSGADWLLGGNGEDTARFGASITLNLATGAHAGEAAGDSYSSIKRFEGSNQGDTMIGGGAGDVFNGRGGDDSLEGGAGNDTLIGGAGIDTLNGGANTDTADYSGAGSAVEVNLAFNIALGTAIGGDWLTSIERVHGSAFGDTIRGDGAANLLAGLGGDDSLIGEGGADTLNGGAGNDTLFGDAGDSIIGGAGTDVLRFTGAPVSVNMATGLHGGGAAGVSISGIERIEGTSGADILVAGNVALVLDGRDGADSLTGGGQGDTLLGGDGNDSLEGLGGSDVLRGGAGADTVVGGSGADVFLWRTGDLGTDLLSGFSLAQDRLSFGTGFLSSPVLGGTGALSEMLDAQAGFAGTALLVAHTAEAGWQTIARLGGVSVRDLDAAIADGSILAALPPGGWDAIG